MSKISKLRYEIAKDELRIAEMKRKLRELEREMVSLVTSTETPFLIDASGLTTYAECMAALDEPTSKDDEDSDQAVFLDEPIRRR